MKKISFLLIVFLFPSGISIPAGPTSSPSTSVIRQIKITGHYPYLKKEIQRLLSIQAGDIFHVENIDENQQRLENFFEKEGYYGTRIFITYQYDPKFNVINLNIKVHKGETYRLGKVSVTGNTLYSTSTLQNRLFSFRHFSLSKIKRKIKKIQQAYIHKGFVRARVRLANMEADPIKKQVNISLEIEEHKKLSVQFIGNSWFDSITLLQQATFYREESYSRFEVDRTTERLIAFYLANGFPKISIHPEIVKNSEDETVVIYTILEGLRVRTKKIDFLGNKTVKKKQLLHVMVLKEHTITQQGLFRPDLLDQDIQALVQHYHDTGYFDAKVIQTQVLPNSFGDQVFIKISVDEGNIYKLTSLQFEGNDSFKASVLLKKGGLKLEKPYNQEKINKILEKISSFYFEKGFPYFKINSSRQVDVDKHTVKLTCSLHEGARATIGDIRIEGNYQTKEKIIRNTLKFKSGDIYTYKKILSGQFNLKRLGIFDYALITPQGIEEEKPIVDVLVKVVERKSFTLDFQGGYDSDKSGAGEITLTKRNIFGLGKQLQFRAIGGFEFDRGEMTFYSPRVWGASWNLVNQYFLEYDNRPNFNASSYGLSLGSLKNYGPFWTLLLKTQFVRLNIYEEQSNQDALNKNLFDSTFAQFIQSLSYDIRDNYSDPQKGIYALFTTEFDTDLADALNTFNITQFSVAHYYGFWKRFTLINNIRLGRLLDLSENPRIPADKLFFMGGNDTIRGFGEDAINPSGGKISAIYNAELHFRLAGELKLAGFFDAGSLTDSFSAISLYTIRDSAGVGLRYITPVGPIRLDYGFVLDKKSGEAGQRFHFSFGYFF